MPERILRDYSTSEKFDGFPGSPETLFVRLLSKVDDYGRFEGDPVNVRGATYPRADNLRANTVDAWLKELSDHRLILCYQVSGKRFLAIVNFRQRLRETNGKLPKPKFPPPDGKPLDFRPDDGDWRALMGISGDSPQVAASGRQLPPYAESDAMTVANASAVVPIKPTIEAFSGGAGGAVASRPGQCGPHGRSAAGLGGPKPDTSPLAPRTASGLLTNAGLPRMAAELCDRRAPWFYDNCKVTAEMFSVASLAPVLREFLGHTEADIREFWAEAVVRAHKMAVDRIPTDDPIQKPGAFCIECFRSLMRGERDAQPKDGKPNHG